MKVHVQVFSFLRSYLPPGSSQRGELDVELGDEATLKDLFQCLGIDRHISQDIFAVAVDHTFQVLINERSVNDYGYTLSDGDTIVMFPPMSGG